MYYLLSSVLALTWLVICFGSSSSSSSKKISAVITTTHKDTVAFERSIASALKHLVDVDKFYVVAPHVQKLKDKVGSLGDRIIYVEENIFPFKYDDVKRVMVAAVKDKGIYPLSGDTPFEKIAEHRTGWFLQQILKLYAGKVLDLGDYLVMDSDLVFFRDVAFVNMTLDSGVVRYNYASSTQYNAPYIATSTRIAGIDFYDHPTYRSGVCHHMVFSKHVLQHLMKQVEERYKIPFWQVVLNESAIELTCKAPKLGICGGMSAAVLSEYEMYFNYARVKFPETVALRPLLWTNGPSPGSMFWPPNDVILESDGFKRNWMHYDKRYTEEAHGKQMEADGLSGFDFVGYHGYGKRRYYEVVGVDIPELCSGVPAPRNSTCSWRGYDEKTKTRSAADWFQGCACWMITHQGGP